MTNRQLVKKLQAILRIAKTTQKSGWLQAPITPDRKQGGIMLYLNGKVKYKKHLTHWANTISVDLLIDSLEDIINQLK